MSQAPSMPLFCDAYLADTMHLSLEEHGAYLKLLMITWRNNGQPLPDDDVRLARMLGVPTSRWKKKLRPVLVEFFNVTGGEWKQKRLEKEWKIQQKISEKQRKNANARWGKENINSLRNNETDDATAYAKRMHPDPDPDPEEKNTGSSTLASGDAAESDPDLAECWSAETIAYLQCGSANTEKSVRAMMGQWLNRNEPGEVSGAIRQARAAAITAPLPWVNKALANRLAERKAGFPQHRQSSSTEPTGLLGAIVRMNRESEEAQHG